MAGIVFLKTKNIQKTKEFYTSVINAKVWIDQKDCIIFRHDNFLFGFCEREGDLEKGWLLTFFYQSPTEVDAMYKKLKMDHATTEPVKNDRYEIYQFYAKDPEGFDLEFQAFLHKIDFNWNNYIK
ncbi:MAG: VOC family protein [Candidatus Heimdallarchaeota archaeon]|nr:MAG: VOC family protein [Candidatus Heimdallarchaeota archaeon]